MIRIFESKGVSEPSLIYVDFILNKFRKEFEIFLDSEDDEIEEDKNYPERDLTMLKSNWYWKDFPVSSISIKYHIKRFEESEYVRKWGSDKEFKTTGACYSIEPKEEGGSYIEEDDLGQKTIHLSMELGLFLKGRYSDMDKILLEVESTILHELNHGYEHWMRLKRKMGAISTNIQHSLDISPKRVNIDVFGYWNASIATFLYWSEEHEIRAMTQDSLPYVRKYSIEDMKRESPSWEASERMIKFDQKKFKSEISEMILRKYGKQTNPDTLLNRIKNSLANEIIKEWELSKDKKIDKPSIMGEKIKSMNIDKFLEFSQRRINNAGEDLRKRILRLYSLKNKDTNEIIF